MAFVSERVTFLYYIITQGVVRTQTAFPFCVVTRKKGPMKFCAAK